MSHAATLAAQLAAYHPEQWKVDHDFRREFVWEFEDGFHCARNALELFRRHEVRIRSAEMAPGDERADWDQIREGTANVIRLCEAGLGLLKTIKRRGHEATVTEEEVRDLRQRAKSYAAWVADEPDHRPPMPLDPQMEADILAVFGT